MHYVIIIIIIIITIRLVEMPSDTAVCQLHFKTASTEITELKLYFKGLHLIYLIFHPLFQSATSLYSTFFIEQSKNNNMANFNLNFNESADQPETNLLTRTMTHSSYDIYMDLHAYIIRPYPDCSLRVTQQMNGFSFKFPTWSLRTAPHRRVGNQMLGTLS